MKKVLHYCYNVFMVFVFFFLLGVCTLYIMQTTKDKGNYLKYQQFYEEKENFDVLFFGSSRILDAVYPMELWQDFGITSYNMAQHSENLNITYWQMKNAFKYNIPKVAVVDLSLLGGAKVKDADVESKSYLHKSLDHMPFSMLKYEALKDLTEDIDLMEYLFPYAMYHNRWSELVRADIYLEDYPLRKGAESRAKIAPLEKVEWSTDEISTSLCVEDLMIDEIIKLCKEYSVEVVFTLMPSPLSSGNKDFCSSINAIELYSQEQGIPVVNFAREDDFINYSLEFSDNSHLNPSGGKKLTSKLGQFLVGCFDFEEKKETTIASWTAAESRYLGTKFGELKIESGEGDIITYLLLLNRDKDLSFDIHMTNKDCITLFELEAILEELQVTEENIVFDVEEDDAVEVTVYRNDTGEILHQGKFRR